MTSLTLRRLEAIEEALLHRLAGEMPDFANARDYGAAADWACEQIARIKRRREIKRATREKTS